MKRITGSILGVGGYLALIGSMWLSGCASGPAGRPAHTAHEATFSPTPSAPTQVNSSSAVTSNGSVDSSGPDIEREGFLANLPAGFIQPSDETGRRLLKEYGAVFLARGGANPPKTVVFRDKNEVAAFQEGVPRSVETLGGVSIQLQAAAMQALKEAAAEAVKNRASITPKGTDAAGRSYQDTVGLWASRVDPGLAHWTAKGKIPAAEAARIRALSPFDQVPEILKLESRGIYFSKDLSKSVLYSVAPPGSSQHLSMLALDVAEHDNPRVREVLAKHGWYQTVISDLPHFTFLGVPENSLPKLGLKKMSNAGRVFWVPDI
jgi:hypothetical protein